MRAGKCVPYIMQQINKFLKDMKTTIKPTVLLAAVLTLAACNPEPVEELHERDIVYTVDNHTSRAHLTTEAEFDALLDRFCDYVEDGKTVSFYNSLLTGTSHASDGVTFSTSDREEMKAWMKAMEDDGKTVTVTYDSTTGIYSGMAYATAPQPPLNEYWVDLGLPSGLLWAKNNVGASCPEELGDYFAWGETTSKFDYSWATYRYGTAYNYLTKYCNMSEYGYDGFTDTLTILEPGDDAATSYMNNSRTPTESEWNELIQHCTGEWTTQNGVAGYRFTGSNGNSIFLPAAGQHDSSGSTVVGEGVHGTYWSANLNMEFPSSARNFHFISEEYATNIAEMTYDGRYHGLSVRAVYDAK